MAISKLNFNSLNVTPTASKGIGFDSGADDLEAGFSGGAMTFIKKLTASSDSTLDFLNGTSSVVFDSTYKEYVFKFINIHPASDNVHFSFQVDTGTNTSYNQAITSTYLDSYHDEGDTTTALEYNTSKDQAQGTSFQVIGNDIGNANDEHVSGTLHIFNPSSSTFVKHFMASNVRMSHNDYLGAQYIVGYVNTTTALTRVQFKFSSGDIDAGTITLYGIN